jgi:hypothetical protein
LRSNYLLEHVIKEKVKKEVKGRRGRRPKKLVDDVKDRIEYFKFAEKALYRPLWRTGFGRGYGPLIWQTTDLSN